MQAACGFAEGVAAEAEGEAQVAGTVRAAGMEVVAGHRRHAGVLDQVQRGGEDCVSRPAPPSTLVSWQVHTRRLEAGPMTAATRGCCPAPRRPGELLTRGDVCHVHADRAAAERCGVLLGGAPELVRLDEVQPAV